MKIGIPRELKDHEYRVAATPAGVRELAGRGHEVFVERDAGAGSSVSNDDYETAGAKIVDNPDDVWGEGELILKVKEPIAVEYPRMQPGQVLFTYLHLAASRECTAALLERKVTGIAYETVRRPDGTLPLLMPMSEVAGRLAPQVGAYHLMQSAGGRGVLPGGVPGCRAAHVVIIGAGVAGTNAAIVAAGMGAEVTLLDRDTDRLRADYARFSGRVHTVTSNAHEIEKAVLEADLVIGAVLVPGARAPRLVSAELVSRMKQGAVLVDIAVDQGGCFEGTRPTTHQEPTYIVHDTVYYCVANMPGAVPVTSTQALTNATLPYALRLAGLGCREALRQDATLANGLNTHNGQVTHEHVATAFGLNYRDPTREEAEP